MSSLTFGGSFGGVVGLAGSGRIGNGNNDVNKRPPRTTRAGGKPLQLSPAANELPYDPTAPVELSGFAYMFIVSFVTLVHAQNLKVEQNHRIGVQFRLTRIEKQEQYD